MLQAFGLSDAGCVRTNNEDYFITDAELGIFILADGMGGANAGEFAAHMGAEFLYEYLRNPLTTDGIGSLEDAFTEANEAVRRAAHANPQLEGMGTTLVVARAMGGGVLQIGAVGDSRAYLFHRGKLSQVTEDQTWVAEVGVRLGLDEETLRRHPMRHVLTMAVGSTEKLRMRSYVLTLMSGDQLLLCSDGLHGVVEQQVLLKTLDSQKNLDEKCHYLIEAAKNKGGPDNVTVVLIRMA